MSKENLSDDSDRYIEILEVKYVPVQLRPPQAYVKWPGIEPDPHGE